MTFFLAYHFTDTTTVALSTGLTGDECIELLQILFNKFRDGFVSCRVDNS